MCSRAVCRAAATSHPPFCRFQKIRPRAPCQASQQRQHQQASKPLLLTSAGAAALPASAAQRQARAGPCGRWRSAWRVLHRCGPHAAGRGGRGADGSTVGFRSMGRQMPTLGQAVAGMRCLLWKRRGDGHRAQLSASSRASGAHPVPAVATSTAARAQASAPRRSASRWPQRHPQRAQRGGRRRASATARARRGHRRCRGAQCPVAVLGGGKQGPLRSWRTAGRRGAGGAAPAMQARQAAGAAEGGAQPHAARSFPAGCTVPAGCFQVTVKK